MEYSKSQLEYIDSVDGMAHNSAIDIIGKLDARIAELEQQLAAAQEREKAFRIGLGKARDLLFNAGKTEEAQEIEALLARFPVSYALEENHEK